MNPESSTPDPVKDSQHPAPKAYRAVRWQASSSQDDRSVERTYIFARRTLLVATFAAIGFVAWTAKEVNNGTKKMFEASEITSDLGIPAEGPDETGDWADAVEVTAISMDSVPPTATINGQCVKEGESVRVQTADHGSQGANFTSGGPEISNGSRAAGAAVGETAIFTARVAKIADGTVELKHRGERRTVTLSTTSKGMPANP